MDLEPIKVILADDNPRVRSGVKTILESQGDITVVGEASNGEQALHLVDDIAPDVLILDIEMPVFNGIEVASTLKTGGTTMPILVLSAYDDNQYILELLKSGVSGYLTKDEVPDILIDAVRGVVRGEYGWVSSRIARKIVHLPATEELKQIKLTTREEKLLKLIARQYTDHDIAQKIGISESAARSSIQTLQGKLNQTSRLGLILQARRNGYL
jgi:DNA-binding NarL/FixJ family response regulator